ncbi:MAG: right-handed parallel beta-helix repeat-containing protein [Nanoarchaeota archaeon]|nr:right-handed parallel beta-helix repeat-containing protein [Nanoarchaeota archaeon]
MGILSFQGWFNQYFSSSTSSIERTAGSASGSLFIENLFGESLYVKSIEDNLTIYRIEIGGVDCGLNTTVNTGITEIDVATCLESLDSSTHSVVLVTENSIVEKSFFLERIIIDYVSVSACGDISASTLENYSKVYLMNSISNQDGNCFTFSTGNLTFDCMGYSITGDGDTSGFGFYINSFDGITIQNCDISGFDDGIYMNAADNCSVLNTSTSNNGGGIRLVNSNYNLFDGIISNYNTNNALGSGYDDGISFEINSNYNILRNSQLSHNHDNGITIFSGSDNNLIDTVVFDNNSNVFNDGTIDIFSGTDNNQVRNSIITNTPSGKYHASGNGNNNSFYNNYFDSSTTNYAGSFSYNYSVGAYNIGNYYESFGPCLTNETRGSYVVCTNPSSFLVTGTTYDYAPLASWS